MLKLCHLLRHYFITQIRYFRSKLCRYSEVLSHNVTSSMKNLHPPHFRHGILGPDRLLVHILEEWLNDIKRNQIPYVLGGVGPVSSLVQIVRGIKVSLIVPPALVLVIVVASLLLPMIVSRHWSLSFVVLIVPIDPD